MMVLATPALADAILPIGGAFGNEAGCDYFMTGSVVGAPLILTPDTFTTAAGGCHFEALTARSAGGFELAASCQTRGSPAARRTVAVSGDRTRGYIVALDGAAYGPLSRCPDADGAFRPLGTQV